MVFIHIIIMLVVDSISLSPVDYSDSALPLLDGSLFNRYKNVINFHFSKYTQPKRLQFKSSGGINTITNINALDYESFLDLTFDGNPLLVGETFKVAGSASNTGTLTITAVTATVITVSNTLTNETLEVGTIYVTSAVTAMDFYYNLIGNQESLSFVSKTDTNVLQKYTITGIACGTTSPVYLNIGTKSNAWVADTLTGIASTSTIAGAGAATGTGATYKQSFIITHYFSQAPYFLANLQSNFSSLLPPSWYSPSISATGLIQGGGLQYVAYLGAKYLSTDITPQNIAQINNQNGISCWLDSNPAGTNPDFSVYSIGYIDNATSLPLTAIDFTKTVNVTIVLKSASAAFVNNTSVIDLNHFYAPLNPSQYQNTNTTLLQNFVNDRIALTVASMPSGVNGLFYGGNYQVIKGAKATYNSTSQVTVTFQAVFASTLQTMLIANPGNRNYGLVCTCEGATNMTRVSVLCDFNSYGYDQTNSTLLKLWDYNHIYPYPGVLGVGFNTIVGREGDKFVSRIPFQLLTTTVNGISPLLQNIVMSVVAKKTGKADFIIESQTINVGASCSFNGQQTPNISLSRGYNTFPNDPFNLITLKPCKDYNGKTGQNLAGYLLSYPFTLRYDYWNSINPSMPGQGNCSAINNDIQNVNNSWSNLINNGWSLVLRFTANVQGYDGYITPFTFDTSITCLNLGMPALTGPTYVETTTYYDANPSSANYGNIVIGILPGSQTRVSMTYTPDGSANPFNSVKGTMWVDLLGQGGVNGAWLASTEIPNPSGSPWSAAAKNGMPTTYYANGLSMNIYSNGVITIEGIYDDTVLGWASQNKQIITPGNMTLYNSGIETAGGVPIETAGGRIILP